MPNEDHLKGELFWTEARMTRGWRAQVFDVSAPSPHTILRPSRTDCSRNWGDLM